jgi:hypothetical protein
VSCDSPSTKRLLTAYLGGDAVRGTQLDSLAELLDRGIRVGFIYGDADIICNWYSGQNASLELAHLLPGYSSAFPAAGYANILVNDDSFGGHVRQYGNLSFSRIFDAGHFVPYYQPETAFIVFSRIIMGKDISWGNETDLATYGTKGTQDSASAHRNEIPASPAHTCWIRDMASSCTPNERAAIARGEGGVSNGIWTPNPAPGVKPDVPSGTTTRSQLSPSDPSETTTKTTTVQLTGVFTATRMPVSTSTSGASSLRHMRARR